MKYLLKRKIQKLYAVEVTEITRKTIIVKSTDKDTTHLNKELLRSSIQMDTGLIVIVL